MPISAFHSEPGLRGCASGELGTLAGAFIGGLVVSCEAAAAPIPETCTSRSTPALCDAFGGLDMRGMKCVLAALRIETYRIDQPVSASNRIGD